MIRFHAPEDDDRHAPKPGDTVWIIPTRYWEPDVFSPERVDVISVDAKHIYGYHHGDGHNGYFSRSAANWFRSRKIAREAQIHLAAIERLISQDDAQAVADHVLRTLAPHIPLPERD